MFTVEFMNACLEKIGNIIGYVTIFQTRIITFFKINIKKFKYKNWNIHIKQNIVILQFNNNFSRK